MKFYQSISKWDGATVWWVVGPAGYSQCVEGEEPDGFIGPLPDADGLTEVQINEIPDALRDFIEADEDSVGWWPS